MIRLGLILAIILFLYCLLRDLLESPAEENLRFDWDAYNQDIERGLDSKTQIQKLRSGAYNTTAPYTVIDLERYYYDLNIYGKEFVDRKKKDGEYSFVCKSIDQKIYEYERDRKFKRYCKEKKAAH